MFVITKIVNDKLDYQVVKLDMADAYAEYDRLLQSTKLECEGYNFDSFGMTDGIRRATFTSEFEGATEKVSLYINKHHLTI